MDGFVPAHFLGWYIKVSLQWDPYETLGLCFSIWSLETHGHRMREQKCELSGQEFRGSKNMN